MESYSLANLVDDLTGLMRRTTDDRRIVTEGKPFMARLILQPALFSDDYRKAAKLDRPSQFVLYRAPDNGLFVTLVIWLQGQMAPVHDHGTWALIGQYEGRMKERRFRRLDDGSRTDHAELHETGTLESSPGEVSHLLPPDEDIHQPTNPYTETSVSIHAYGRCLSTYWRHIYDPANGRVSPLMIDNYDTVAG